MKNLSMDGANGQISLISALGFSEENWKKIYLFRELKEEIRKFSWE